MQHKKSGTKVECKICTKCNESKPIDDFFPRYRKGELEPRISSWCKKCHTASGKKYKQGNADARARYAEQRRVWHFAKKFGITPADYDRMLAKQGGHCALCPVVEGSPNHVTNKPRLLAVDHDHETGVVRGLLCEKCNRGIGLLGDDPGRLRAAARYVAKHKA